MKIENHENIAMLAVSALNTISSLISNALSEDSISDDEYALILLEFETFTRNKEDLRIKCKTSFESSYFVLKSPTRSAENFLGCSALS